MRKWQNRKMLGTVLLIGLPGFWLLVDNHPGPRSGSAAPQKYWSRRSSTRLCHDASHLSAGQPRLVANGSRWHFA